MTAGSRSQNGDAVTETVVVVPALMLLVILVIQVGLWWHAQHVVTAVAREGVKTARLSGSTAEDGRRRALGFLAATGGGVVLEPTVVVARANDRATAQVSGRAVAVLPGLALPVRSSAVGRTEVFRGDLS